MKVAFLLGSLNRGGTENLVLDLLRNVNQNNFEAVFVYRKSGSLEDEFLKLNIDAQKIKRTNFIKYLQKLRQYLDIQKVDIVHCNQAIDAIWSFFANLFSERKLVLTVHQFDFEEKLFTRIILFIAFRLTKYNIFVSDFQRKYFQKKYFLNEEKQKVVYNGVSFEKFDSIVDHKISLRQELNIDNSTLLLGSVGNFVNVRDQITICKSLKDINDTNFHFVFVGKKDLNYPRLFDDCVEFCKANDLSERVTFLGERKDVPVILKQLDGFIYATNHDTFGIALVEAIASGIPVIANNWPVFREISKNEDYILFYETKNIQDLSDKINFLINNIELIKSKSSLNAQIIKIEYSIKNHINNLKMIYNSII